ncbi:hydroxypyruvate isomerase family protein [Pseudorhodoplanes sinuspersici]|uniref:Isomerase n=1 Tax=Pseudorhodoplanes sinuspersici TaxID=1235591 RepID=A0A1W6ZUG5_9HYPH|nr:TIM barrel protein [Pseudorhodoplanes sinuspersici]ARQ00405.1 isomerase [Pseudorhodoplanes sinuspersici]RKE67430.1 hydroxypyruvate isomerase [Pseudorhodoplanes sinuspersici]
MPRFAANIAYLFSERPLIERPTAAAAGGFAAVEGQFPYDTPASALRAQIEQHKLTMLGINTERGGNGQFGMAAVPNREREFDTLFKQALDYIVAVGGSAIHCLAGIVPVDQRPAAERTFIANLTRVADLAAEKNITLLIEPINNIDRPGYFLNRCEHAADIIAKIGKPNIRIQFDFYHAQIMGGDLIRRFEKHLPLIGHVQIAAVPSRHEPDEGEVCYREIYKALDALGYRGWVAGEYFPRGRTEDGLEWLKAAKTR